MKEIENLYQDTYAFNSIAGNFDNVNEERVDTQLSLIFEELTETIEAFENRNEVELLDGAIDILVTGFGLIQYLAKLGFDVEEAMWRIRANNLSKFPRTLQNKLGLPLPQDYVAQYNPEYDVYCFKDATGKIRKPLDFMPVDITTLVPGDFFKQQYN